MNLWSHFIHPVTRHFRRGRGDFLSKSFRGIGTARICDLGGSRHFWDKLGLDVPYANITIYNISTVETESVGALAESEIPIVIYDGHRIPVPDKHFDLLICNSVLEHVPPPHRPALAAEMERVSKAVFCQTPAFSFPIEPHFIMPFVHWLPRGLGYHLIKFSPWRLLSRPSVDTMRSYWSDTRLLDRRELQALFPTAEIIGERMLGLTKSYYAIING